MKQLFILLLIIAFLGCQEEIKPKKPADLIPMEKMEKILYEIYILNAAKGINKKILEVKGLNPESYVFEKYDIDSIQFAESNEYYAYNIEQYESILDTLKYRIDLEKSLWQEKKNQEELDKKRSRDSIRESMENNQDSVISDLKKLPRKISDSILK